MRLVEERDPLLRAGLHLELATISLGHGEFEHAARHFREALHHDGTLLTARDGLHSLGQGPTPRALVTRKGPFARFFQRFRRK